VAVATLARPWPQGIDQYDQHPSEPRVPEDRHTPQGACPADGYHRCISMLRRLTRCGATQRRRDASRGAC